MNIKRIINLFKDDDDLIIRLINNITILYFESLCDGLLIYEYVVKNTTKIQNKDDINKLISSPKLIKIKTIKDGINMLQNGFCLISINKDIYAIEVKAPLDRGINTPLTESSMYGPKDSFCENYQKNLGLLKRKIKSNNLVIKNYLFGNNTKTIVSAIYINNLVNKDYLNDVLSTLNSIDIDLIDETYIYNKLNRSKIFSTILKTEKPSVCAKYLLKGYIILLIDNTPFSLVIDMNLFELINYQTHDNFIKILRLSCLFLTILIPAFYIGLINYNQETIPTSLLINISNQRLNVPFPSIIEIIIMLIICEVLRETDIRFPNNFGSASSILGALIIGEAAVSAGIVSPIMIIIVAITFITSLIFTEVKFTREIRFLRILSLLSASFLGLYGLALSSILIINLLTRTNLKRGYYL